MTTLEKIRKEIEQNAYPIVHGVNNHEKGMTLYGILQIFDKYAEQEPCEDCDYSEIMDWEQDAKTGKAKPIYWCKRHKEPCDDVVSRQAVLENAWTLESPDASSEEVVSVKDVKKLPTVQPKAKVGYWNEIMRHPLETANWQCSECYGVVYEEKTDFCPFCGARMVDE